MSGGAERLTTKTSDIYVFQCSFSSEQCSVCTGLTCERIRIRPVSYFIAPLYLHNMSRFTTFGVHVFSLGFFLGSFYVRCSHVPFRSSFLCVSKPSFSVQHDPSLLHCSPTLSTVSTDNKVFETRVERHLTNVTAACTFSSDQKERNERHTQPVLSNVSRY